MNWIHKHFSHLYIEEAAFRYPLTRQICRVFPTANIIRIQNYKEIFNRSGQNFQIQKKSRKLILAVKEAARIYPATDLCSFESGPFMYYTTPIINCLYDCAYCFLQGMYPSANIVVFVNQNDFIKEAVQIADHQPIQLSVSYETDLALFEHWTSLCKTWIKAAEKKKNLFLEIRSKTDMHSIVSGLKPVKRVILAWSLSPPLLIDRYEPMTASFEQRLKAAQKAIRRGWSVRLCWDPVLAVSQWETLYEESIRHVFSILQPQDLVDVQIGVFRMNAEYLKKIRRVRHDSDVVFQPMKRQGTISTYPPEIRRTMLEKITGWLSQYLPPDKILINETLENR